METQSTVKLREKKDNNRKKKMISKLSVIMFFAVAVIGLNATCPANQNNQASTIHADIASTTLASSQVFIA